MEFEISNSVRVRVVPPSVPSATELPPYTIPVHVVPITGPQGPPGVGGGDAEAVAELIDDAVSAHVDSSAPHPAYDDLPSLTLIFNNGLV